MAKIQIFSVLGKNGILFGDFLYKTMTQLASNSHELEFNCFMSSTAKSPKGWIAREYILKQKHTSLNHTIGLNHALNYIDGDFFIAADADVALILPGWDDAMVNMLKLHSIDILGVGHKTKTRLYQNFPIVTFFIAKSDSHLKAHPDLRPKLVPYENARGIGTDTLLIENEADSHMFEMSRGQYLLQDSGWQLPVAYKSKNLRGKIFQPGKAYSIEEVPQIWNIDGQLALCHKQKSSKRRQSHGYKYIDSITKYIKKTHNIEIT